MRRRYYMLILLGLGLLTRFAFFGYPSQTVFDEVHFGKFISGYYTGEYFFDIHPPLGKITIAGFAKFFDFKPGFAFSEIGNKFPDKQYLILRFLPSLAGAILPLVIYLLLVELGVSSAAAFFGGLLIVFENALLTQSRFILMDSFLLLFGFASLFFYFKYKNSELHATYYLLLAGIFSGMSFSVKWTGISFLAIIIILELLKLWGKQDKITLKHLFKLFLVLLVIPATIYVSIFIVHLKLLDKSGPGDAFMSQGFQKTLSGNLNYNNTNIAPSNLLQKFIELNEQMYEANQRLTATHPYSSTWYSWPFMSRPIFYWVNGDARIYLIGNPLIWLASTIAVLFLIISLLSNKFKNNKFTPYFLLGAYAVNLLPFIGVKRVMFLYHYFTAYIFAVIMLVWLLDQYSSSSPDAKENSKKIFGAILAISITVFIYFAPLTYGLSLSSKAYEARVWFSSWR